VVDRAMIRPTNDGPQIFISVLPNVEASVTVTFSIGIGAYILAKPRSPSSASAPWTRRPGARWSARAATAWTPPVGVALRRPRHYHHRARLNSPATPSATSSTRGRADANSSSLNCQDAESATVASTAGRAHWPAQWRWSSRCRKRDDLPCQSPVSPRTAICRRAFIVPRWQRLWRGSAAPHCLARSSPGACAGSTGWPQRPVNWLGSWCSVVRYGQAGPE
jgi:hypothetical protein